MIVTGAITWWVAWNRFSEHIKAFNDLQKEVRELYELKGAFNAWKEEYSEFKGYILQKTDKVVSKGAKRGKK